MLDAFDVGLRVTGVGFCVMNWVLFGFCVLVIWSFFGTLSFVFWDFFPVPCTMQPATCF